MKLISLRTGFKSVLFRAGEYGLIVLLLWLSFQGHAPASTRERVLVVQNSQTGNRYEIPVTEGEVLTIRFFHSYDRQWVKESFRIDDDQFVPSEVIFKDDSYDYRYQRYHCRQMLEHGSVHMMDIKPLPTDILRRIITRVAYTRSQQLILTDGGKRHVFKFYAWGSPGQRLVFSLEY